LEDEEKDAHSEFISDDPGYQIIPENEDKTPQISEEEQEIIAELLSEVQVCPFTFLIVILHYLKKFNIISSSLNILIIFKEQQPIRDLHTSRASKESEKLFQSTASLLLEGITSKDFQELSIESLEMLRALLDDPGVLQPIMFVIRKLLE
jgi:hypothetical protein